MGGFGVKVRIRGFVCVFIGVDGTCLSAVLVLGGSGGAVAGLWFWSCLVSLNPSVNPQNSNPKTVTL